MNSGTTLRTRAARLRLIGQLDLARRAGDLLHSKERALERERARLEAYATRTQEQWNQRCHEATTWLLRARMLGAGDEISALIIQGPQPATVTAHWQASMGITYPGSVECAPGMQPHLISTAALGPTVDAYQQALQAAGQHGATSVAVQRLDAELTATRRRRRAIQERLLPRLDVELQQLDLHLDEQDREEALRVHLATTQQESTQS